MPRPWWLWPDRPHSYRRGGKKLDRPVIREMAFLRFFSGLLEIVAALIFLRVGRVETALRLNALLGLVGPLVLVLVSLLGLVSLAARLSPGKIALVTLGVVLILCGTRV
ncbi:MAG: DUF2619 domain-containing protein [Firmicutes bacterium]|nr:DUF2619 domain-containing protein [Bacillota bacterium]